MPMSVPLTVVGAGLFWDLARVHTLGHPTLDSRCVISCQLGATRTIHLCTNQARRCLTSITGDMARSRDMDRSKRELERDECVEEESKEKKREVG